MNKIIILGAGMAGTTVANRLYKTLDTSEWHITLVDRDEVHYYQPGFLFIPFGIYEPKDVIKTKRNFIHSGIEFVLSDIDRVSAEDNQVHLANGNVLHYDQLIIATGTTPRPDETDGLDSPAYGDTIHDFYTFSGANALADKLRTWEGGKLVVNIMEMPIKCPVAPLEFAFLADAFFKKRGLRDKVDITYVTPLPGAFTKPTATALLGNMLDQRDIRLVPEFNVMEVDTEHNRLISYEEDEIAYDLLVTVPVNMGAEYVERSGIGDELNHIPVDKHTFVSKQYSNIFALGDAAALPTSKAGSVAHFSIDVFVENFVAHIDNKPLPESFDGHANCFIETGNGKGMLIDFNYDVEPLPGKFPFDKVGPFDLLKETRRNHWGKLAFKPVYWNLLLKGYDLHLPAAMSMTGKAV